jgi:hypothetical protein
VTAAGEAKNKVVACQSP